LHNEIGDNNNSLLLGFGFAQEPASSPERKSNDFYRRKAGLQNDISAFFTVGKGTTTVDNNYHTKTTANATKLYAFMQRWHCNLDFESE